MKWAEAETFCADGNGHLTSIESGIESNFLLGKPPCGYMVIYMRGYLNVVIYMVIYVYLYIYEVI